MVTFPYNTTDFAFTLTDDAILFSSTENSYFDATILIKYYDFYSATEKTETLEYKIPLFNASAKWFVGAIIHRNISVLKAVFTNGFQQKTTLVTFTINEISLDDGTTLNTTSLTDVKFIPGPAPKLLENNIGLLNANTWYCKATISNLLNVSFLLPNETHQINYYVNETLISSEEVVSAGLDNVFTKQINTADFTLEIGDILKIQVNNSIIYKEFLIDKAIPNSTTLFFINKFNLLDTIVFTGEYLFSEEPEQITQLYRNNQRENLEVIANLQNNFLKIDTGWLYKEQLKLIDHLLDSKKVIINNLDNYNLELVPISKKRTGIDSKKNKFSFSLEFRINSKTDA